MLECATYGKFRFNVPRERGISGLIPADDEPSHFSATSVHPRSARLRTISSEVRELTEQEFPRGAQQTKVHRLPPLLMDTHHKGTKVSSVSEGCPWTEASCTALSKQSRKQFCV